MHFDNTWLTYFLLITIFVFWMVIIFNAVLLRYVAQDYKLLREAKQQPKTTTPQYNANSSWHQDLKKDEQATDVVNEFWPHPH